jgi:hypothetical protein
LQLGQWQEAEHNPAEKVRTVAFNLPLNVNLGVKTTRTTETQVNCNSCSIFFFWECRFEF